MYALIFLELFFKNLSLEFGKNNNIFFKISLTSVKSLVQSFLDMDLVRNLFGTTRLLIYFTRCLRPSPTIGMGRVAKRHTRGNIYWCRKCAFWQWVNNLKTLHLFGVILLHITIHFTQRFL